MKNLIITIFRNVFVLIIIMASNECNLDEPVIFYELTSFERNSIPYTTTTSLRYENESGELFEARALKVIEEEILINKSHTNSDVQEWGKLLSSQLESTNTILNFTIVVSKYSNDKVALYILKQNTHGFLIQNSTGYLEDLYLLARDVNMASYSFKEVYVLSGTSNNGGINRILYSRKKGIEFIELTNGGYYKLL